MKWTMHAWDEMHIHFSHMQRQTKNAFVKHQSIYFHRRDKHWATPRKNLWRIRKIFFCRSHWVNKYTPWCVDSWKKNHTHSSFRMNHLSLILSMAYHISSIIDLYLFIWIFNSHADTHTNPHIHICINNIYKLKKI